MSIFSKLFGGAAKEDVAKPLEYNGFQIFAEPMKESGGFRIAGRIEKEIDGTQHSHQMIRADVCSSLEEAILITQSKSKAFIDQMGDKIFS